MTSASPPVNVSAGMDPASPDLRAALFRLDLRLRMVVETFRIDLAERARDPFRGLYISDTDIDELLASVPASELAQRLLDEEVGPVPERLRRLSELFELETFEREALLVCLAPDVDVTSGCTPTCKMTSRVGVRLLTSFCGCSACQDARAAPTNATRSVRPGV
jgi:hypothetical protein